MSRIGKKPIIVPADVTVAIAGQEVRVSGKTGELSYTAHPDIAVEMKDQVINCQIRNTTKKSSALWGTTRARIANMVQGISAGFSKDLEIQGVGYKALIKGNDLELIVGFSHPVVIAAPAGIKFSVEQQIIKVAGIDKILVGQMAAKIRAVKKPEPYKGKGIRYVGEHVRRKVGKVVGTTT